MKPPSRLRIGTRKSPLALAQAEAVEATLVPMSTSGDRMQQVNLSEIGGKGLFTKEIEEALLADETDIAVHSLKDIPTELPPGLVLAAMLPRADARDMFLSDMADSLQTLPPGARVGTSALRRCVLVKRLRPDLIVVPLRGNVQTRLEKLRKGEVDATILAAAGLDRLGLRHVAKAALPAEEFLPAVGQGIIAIECREGRLREWLSVLNHLPTSQAAVAERALLARLDGSCRTPIAGYATLDGESMRIRGMLARADGSACWYAERHGAATDAYVLGRELGDDLLAQANRHA